MLFRPSIKIYNASLSSIFIGALTRVDKNLAGSHDLFFYWGSSWQSNDACIVWQLLARINDDNWAVLVALPDGMKTCSRTISSILKYDILLTLPIVQTDHQLATIIFLVHIVCWSFNSSHDTAA